MGTETSCDFSWHDQFNSFFMAPINVGINTMFIVYVFVFSFGVALAVGFISVIFQHGSEKVYENELVKKVGEWLFLLPIITFVEKKSNTAFSNMEGFSKNFSIEKTLQNTLKFIASIGIFVVILGATGYFLFWLITNYFFVILFILIVIIVVAKFNSANK